MERHAPALRQYYSEVGEHELLGSEGERDLAAKIEDRETDVWERILGSAAVRPLVLEKLEASLGQSLPEFAKLRRAATVARKERTSTARRALTKRVRLAAAEVRTHDRDREHLEEVVADLAERAKTNRNIARCLRSVRTAERAAAAVREEFVNANLRLVVSLARKFSTYGLPMEDLIQEGNLGLIKAVDRFDYRRGYRFSTYASWWIRHMLGRAVANTARTVRVPVHVLDTHQRVRRAERSLAARLGRSPTHLEIAEALEMTPEQVEAARTHAGSFTLSLDQPIEEEGAPRQELLRLPANDETTAADVLEEAQQIDRMGALLESLSPIQADVLRKRFGLGDEEAKTLQEIADGYGLSRERIRQIEVAALAKLRTAFAESEIAA